MANGWAPDGAVQEQIDDNVKDALAAVQSPALQNWGVAKQSLPAL
jgi:hypothetical protein